MNVDTGTGALMLSTATAVPSIMGAFMDKPVKTATGPADPTVLGEQRRGELMGATVSLTVAAVLASIIDNPAARRLVLVTTVLMVAVFVAEHERAIRVSPQVGEQES